MELTQEESSFSQPGKNRASSQRPLAVLLLGTFALALALTTWILYRAPNPVVKWQLEQDLGCKIGTPTYWAGNEHVEVFAAVAIQPGSLAAQAGLKEGEILLDPTGSAGHPDLFDWLEQNRGRPTTLTVLPGGNGLPLNARPRRTITLTLPARSAQ